MWGGSIATLQRNFEQTGVMPPALENRPSLTIYNSIYYEAFSVLSGARQNGMDINPIVFTEVMAYCSEIGVDYMEDRLTFWRMVHGCDNELITLQHEKREAKKK